MKISFRSFAIGFCCATLSLGAVTYANAAGNTTLKACASKATGTMRYISKGSCKKTETSLSWNQMGPQGLAGTAGVTGAIGIAGAPGANGTNGQNLYVVDANGQTLGKYLGVLQDAYMFMADTRLWIATPFKYGFWNFTGGVTYYSDSQCTNRLININKDDEVHPNSSFIEWNLISDYGPSGGIQKAFVPSNSTKMTFSSFSNLYSGGQGTGCGIVTAQSKIEMDGYSRLVTATEITKPNYVAPLTIVAK